jgi:hypothetical protein
LIGCAGSAGETKGERERDDEKNLKKKKKIILVEK